MAHTAARVLLALCLGHGLAAAYDAALGPRAIDEAIAVGQSRTSGTTPAFHAPYRISVGQPPIDYIEVVTPFRRVALAAEERARIGDRSFGQRDALALLAAARGGLELVVEMTFHPLNTFVGVPPYDVVLEDPAAGGTIAPQRLDRVPRFGPRVDGLPVPWPFRGPDLPDGSEPLQGGTLVAPFEGALLQPSGVYDVVIGESGTELARVRMDLGRIR